MRASRGSSTCAGANAAHPLVTLVGKGVCFDTGGLDIKPGSGMILMKKDMGGAALALALARMLMGADAPVQLRLLIPAVENCVSGRSYRPSDILRSRAGAHRRRSATPMPKAAWCSPMRWPKPIARSLRC